MAEKVTMGLGKSNIATAMVPTWDEPGNVRPCLEMMIARGEPILELIDKIPKDYVHMSELALEEEIRRKHDQKFDRTLGLIKVMFWDEYRSALTLKKPMVMERVWKPLVPEGWWNTHVLKNKLHLAWVITPPADEIVAQKEMLQLGFKRLREAFDLPLIEKTKGIRYVDDVRKEVIVEKVNIPLLKELHSIVKTLQERVHGAVLQRQQIESKNLHVVANTTPEAAKAMAMAPTLLDDPSLTIEQLEAYDQKLAKIENRIVDLVGPVPDGVPDER